MTDRDRLAADLHEVIAGVRGLGDRPDLWGASADRLIALGWTRLDEGRLVISEEDMLDGWKARDEERRAAVEEAASTLDAERLARALHRATGMRPQDEARDYAAAIAKAYREDEG